MTEEYTFAEKAQKASDEGSFTAAVSHHRKAAHEHVISSHESAENAHLEASRAHLQAALWYADPQQHTSPYYTNLATEATERAFAAEEAEREEAKRQECEDFSEPPHPHQQRFPAGC